MIALLIAAIFGWSSPCFAFPAQHDPVTATYAQSIGFSAPAGAPRLWSTQPISMTVTYADHTDTAPISLRQSLALFEQDGAFSSRAPLPYTIYLCAADTRPGAVWIPMI